MRGYSITYSGFIDVSTAMALDLAAEDFEDWEEGSLWSMAFVGDKMGG
jgi:hypothetical protein